MKTINITFRNLRSIQKSLYILNFLLMVTGIILINIGQSIENSYSLYSNFLEIEYFSIPSLLISIGIIIFIVVLFGLYGVIQKNYYIILAFTALMIIIFILELVAGIYGFVLKNGAAEIVEKKMFDSMKFYGDDNHIDITKLWDTIQKQLRCCGSNSPENWINTWNELNRLDLFNNKSLPISCCDINYGSVDEIKCVWTDKKDKLFYRGGCSIKIGKFISSHALKIGGFGLGIAFSQALGILFTLYVAMIFKKNYMKKLHTRYM